jgi:polyisoprenoid-binding protein YceI
MNKIASIVTALLLVPFAAQAQGMQPVSYETLPSGTYASDPTHTSLNWKILHMGLSHYTARFKKVDATVTFDAKNPAASKLVATVDPTSITTDYPVSKEHDFDKELQGEKWFDAVKHPTIKFESTGIVLTDKTHGKITGNLTFLGVTKPLVLDATFNGAYPQHPFDKKPVMGFSATAKLKRSDWGMTNYIPMIGDDVDLLIETELHKKD